MNDVTNSLILGLAIAAMPFAMAARGPAPAPKGAYLVYIGTYTGPQSKGIYVLQFQPATGGVTEPELAGEVGNPSWLAIHPNRRFLYAVSEYNSEKSSVSAFSIDSATGKLKLLNAVGSGGNSAVSVAIDSTGKNALVANYGGGSVAVRRIGNDGSLGEQTAFVQHKGSSVTPRQRKPWAHSIYLSPDNRFALVPDLGLDKVLVYRFDAAKGTLAANDPPSANIKPGSGPRHLSFHPKGKFAYVISEMARTVTAFAWDAKRGALVERQTISTLPSGAEGKVGAAEVQAAPDGRFLYASNRGPDTIAVFSIDPKAGTLTAVEQMPTQGVMPRSFSIDPTGSYLFAANQSSNNIVIFHIDGKTGRLSPTGRVLSVGAPVCVSFMRLK